MSLKHSRRVSGWSYVGFVTLEMVRDVFPEELLKALVSKVGSYITVKRKRDGFIEYRMYRFMGLQTPHGKPLLCLYIRRKLDIR